METLEAEMTDPELADIAKLTPEDQKMLLDVINENLNELLEREEDERN